MPLACFVHRYHWMRYVSTQTLLVVKAVTISSPVTVLKNEMPNKAPTNNIRIWKRGFSFTSVVICVSPVVVSDTCPETTGKGSQQLAKSLRWFDTQKLATWEPEIAACSCHPPIKWASPNLNRSKCHGARVSGGVFNGESTWSKNRAFHSSGVIATV